jgi:hypothetical protein
MKNLLNQYLNQTVKIKPGDIIGTLISVTDQYFSIRSGDNYYFYPYTAISEIGDVRPPIRGYKFEYDLVIKINFFDKDEFLEEFFEMQNGL